MYLSAWPTCTAEDPEVRFSEELAARVVAPEVEERAGL